MPTTGKRRKGKQGGRSTPLEEHASADTAAAVGTTASVSDSNKTDTLDLILTSEKRRGVYECDYCHSDISQLPRIRCANCADFDLCLDCFATTDHAAAIQRLKAAASVTGLLQEDGTAAAATGVSSAAIHHDDSHGYRVCDCTQWPLFASSRTRSTGTSTVAPSSKANSVVDDKGSEAGNESMEASTAKPEDEAIKQEDEAAESKEAMQVEPEAKVSAAAEENQASFVENKETLASTEETSAKNEEALSKNDEGTTKKEEESAKMEEATTEEVVGDTTKKDEDIAMKDEDITMKDESPKKDEDTTKKDEDTSKKDDDTSKKDDAQDPASQDKEAAPTEAALKEAQAEADAADEDESMSQDSVIVVPDDPRSVWTVEEDLRLLEGIKTHGLGNWVEISEAVGGRGSAGKTPKRCMERFFDDFLGRYGHILPAYILTTSEEAADEDDMADAKPSGGDGEPAATIAETVDTPARASKRRSVLLRTPSNVSTVSWSRKKYKAVPTASLAGYEHVWPNPYLPPIDGVQIGQEVGRDQAYKAELMFVKTTMAMESKEEVEKLRSEWKETRLLKPGGPTVLPPRPNDIINMPGSELEGFMPRRGDFDVEWENDAEQAVADMEFLPGESAQDRQLKLDVMAIYNSKLDERDRRKQFILSRGLHNYRQNQAREKKLPRDELDLVHRMRLFERFHTPQEHQQFLDDLLKAKRLRKEIAKLQMYRRIGIRTLAEAERYELDKNRRQFHKLVHLQKEAEAAKAEAAEGADTKTDNRATGSRAGDEIVSSSMWKQYRTGDRKIRKSINRGNSNVDANVNKNVKSAESSPTQAAEMDDKSTTAAAVTGAASTAKAVVATNDDKPSQEAATNDGTDAMQIDEPNGGETKKQAVAGDVNKEAEKSQKDDQEDVAMQVEEKPKDDDKQVASSDKPAVATAPEDAFVLSPGYHLLSSREISLCQKVGLLPAQYLEIKRALIHESLTQGLLDKEGPASSRRTIAMIDVERRDDVIDFMVRAGWISTKLGSSMNRDPAIVQPTERSN